MSGKNTHCKYKIEQIESFIFPEPEIFLPIKSSVELPSSTEEGRQLPAVV